MDEETPVDDPRADPTCPYCRHFTDWHQGTGPVGPFRCFRCGCAVQLGRQGGLVRVGG